MSEHYPTVAVYTGDARFLLALARHHEGKVSDAKTLRKCRQAINALTVALHEMDEARRERTRGLQRVAAREYRKRKRARYQCPTCDELATRRGSRCRACYERTSGGAA